MVERRRVNIKIFLAAGLAALFFLLSACARAPFTGRRQLLLTSESQENALGYRAFQDISRKYPSCRDPEINALVQKVGHRIARAAARPDFRWDFKVYQDDKMANAFCLPGGKVGVFTGILKYTKDEGGMATVLAHEAAHAILRHAGERLSQSLLMQLGGIGLNVALQGQSPYLADAILQAYGLGATVGVLLPYSRTQEYEADRVGLILMAKAGYDPAQALEFWQRMLKSKKGKPQPPQFLSTHPTDADRIRQIKRTIAIARRYYHPQEDSFPQPSQPRKSLQLRRRTSPLVPFSVPWSRHRSYRLR
ncbi:MAG: M48 family metallopeptidase [Deltaproteobacteria bacterium]|nr:M48 family metallopeptidase [Deltaproteobacteria bacterium]MBW1952869.1 M48 family metallopeptidase [Deltaproteobacteria bacterium]MBW1985867.1 M48 family metallopeptidase [Deltaproteobacteria bacterium]MBW2133627.1 M48 family metallopeptidase [Deltaproteobacteria bacterium]